MLNYRQVLCLKPSSNAQRLFSFRSFSLRSIFSMARRSRVIVKAVDCQKNNKEPTNSTRPDSVCGHLELRHHNVSRTFGSVRPFQNRICKTFFAGFPQFQNQYKTRRSYLLHMCCTSIRVRSLGARGPGSRAIVRSRQQVSCG